MVSLPLSSEHFIRAKTKYYTPPKVSKKYWHRCLVRAVWGVYSPVLSSVSQTTRVGHGSEQSGIVALPDITITNIRYDCCTMRSFQNAWKTQLCYLTLSLLLLTVTHLLDSPTFPGSTQDCELWTCARQKITARLYYRVIKCNCSTGWSASATVVQVARLLLYLLKSIGSPPPLQSLGLTQWVIPFYCLKLFLFFLHFGRTFLSSFFTLAELFFLHFDKTFSFTLSPGNENFVHNLDMFGHAHFCPKLKVPKRGGGLVGET